MLTFAIRQLASGGYAGVIYRHGREAIAMTLRSGDRNLVAARAVALIHTMEAQR
jgi:hypothetical protein